MKQSRSTNAGLNLDLPEVHLWDTVQRLSFLQKRRGEYLAAIDLWQQAATQKFIYAFVEMAKYYEHQQRKYEEAAYWTRLALEILAELSFLPSHARNGRGSCSIEWNG